MVHQHFKLVHNFTVLENIVLGVEEVKNGFLSMKGAREKVMELSRRYHLMIDPDAEIQDITVGMQQSCLLYTSSVGDLDGFRGEFPDRVQDQGVQLSRGKRAVGGRMAHQKASFRN